jgi:hypothetical protein
MCVHQGISSEWLPSNVDVFWNSIIYSKMPCGNIRKMVCEAQNAINLPTDCWECFNHPPYSPHLMPSNFHLFRTLKNGVSGNYF